jgi:hypothetical protein
MARWDPTFKYFQQASGYRNRRTDHEAKFKLFLDYMIRNERMTSMIEDVVDTFVIQFVCHPNFHPESKDIVYYVYNGHGNFDSSTSLPLGFARANSFKNYKTTPGIGHEKGLFYELNLYTSTGISHHHTSRVKGTRFERDDSHDQRSGITKGQHWLE